MTTIRTPAFLAASVLAVAGCGGTEIDAGKAEALIKQSIAGPPPKDVDCPDGVEAKKGSTFRCSVLYAEGIPTATVTVHIVDDDGHIRVGPGDFKEAD